MNKSLATFMSLAGTAVILSALLFGIVYDSLKEKNNQDNRVLQREYNLQLKGGD